MSEKPPATIGELVARKLKLRLPRIKASRTPPPQWTARGTYSASWAAMEQEIADLKAELAYAWQCNTELTKDLLAASGVHTQDFPKRRRRNRIDEEKRRARLRALGLRGPIPDELTDEIIRLVRRHPPGARFPLADGQVPGLVLGVGEKRGAATFSLQYRTVAGLRRMHKIGKVGAMTLDHARALAREARVAVARGGDPAAEKQERGATVRTYLERTYSPQVLAKHKYGAGTKARILSAWKPLLDVKLACVTRDRIKAVLANRGADGKRAGTRERDWGAFRALLADAVDRGRLAGMPVATPPIGGEARVWP